MTVNNKITNIEQNEIKRQADHWFVQLLSDNCTNKDQSRFLDWITLPEHVLAYEEAKALYEDLQFIKDCQEITALRKAVMSDPKLSTDKSVPLTEMASTKQSIVVSLFSSGKKAYVAACSIGFSVAASLLVFTLLPYFQGIHQTGVGEIRTLALEDGTKVMLDTDSEIRVAFDDNERVVYLRSGRAHFEVAKNANRPFTVKSNRNAVTAVGTAFSVNNIDDQFIVRLNEGIVDIISSKKANGKIRLVEGEQWMQNTTYLGVKQKIDMSKMGWMKGALVFESTPLSDVVAQINRYSTIKIHLANQQLSTNTIDAVFHVGKTESFAVALERMLDANLTYSSNGDIVLSR